MNEQAQALVKYLEKSHWKKYLISAILFNPDHTIYQKEIMRNKSAGTRFGFNKYIKEPEGLPICQSVYNYFAEMKAS